MERRPVSPTAETFMSHLALSESAPDGAATTWHEPVSDEQYRAAHEQ